MLFKLVSPSYIKANILIGITILPFLYMIGTVLLKANVVSFYPIGKVPK